MNVSLNPATQHQIERMVDDLCSEFAGEFPRSQIEEVMADSVDRIGEVSPRPSHLRANVAAVCPAMPAPRTTTRLIAGATP